MKSPIPSHWHKIRAVLSSRFQRPRSADLLMLALLALVVMGGAVIALALLSSVAEASPLSAGDRLQLTVESGEDFSGRYQIDAGGRVQLPYAGAVAVAGLEPEQAAAAVTERLVAARLMKRGYARTSVQVLWWAPIDVRISGAVFYPGAHRINQPPARERAADRVEDLPGAQPPERRLSDALRAAGGITPWADLAHIAVRRAGQTRLYDLRGLLLGVPGDDPPLQAGDEVLVATTDTAQPALARPSAITPPGIKIFVSNTIQPVAGNANASVSGGALSLAYGARLSQAVLAADCAGGTVGTNAGRHALLLRTDRVSGATQNWDRPIEALMRQGDDVGNPVLLEGDALACYDSGVTSVRDLFRTLADILLPFALGRGRL